MTARPRAEGAQGPGAAGEPGTNRAFQHVLDSVPGAWFFTRRSGQFAYVNKGACLGLGYTREELLDRTIFDVDPGMTAEQWQALWATTPPNDPVTVRALHRRQDGSEFPVEVRASLVRIEGEDLAASYTVDLTLSERTQSTNVRLLAAIEQTNEAVVVTDAAGNVEYVNPAYERTSGLRASEVCGWPWRELEIRDEASLLSGFSGVLQNGVPWSGRIQSKRRDGALYDEEVSLSPIRDDAGLLVGCVAVKRDISEQLLLEQQLRQAQKVDAVGQLARGIAHDFNNLLQVIHGQSQLIAIQSDPARSGPMLNEISDAVERAASLVRQLLAFSRTGTIEIADVRLDALVSALLDMLRRLLGEHIELDWRCSSGPAWVRGNAPQLEQVVANLCINARDAMPEGGCLRLSLARARRDEIPAGSQGLRAEQTLVLTVQDEGCGMDDEVQRRVFEPFYTTKDPGRGTGLGLATVAAVVEAHGGRIDVRSVPGEGSTFRVFLPMSQQAATEPARPDISSGVQGRGRLALVAEDEPAVRKLTVCYLEAAGFRVLAAADGIEAEQLLRRSGIEPAIAVIDAVMPRRGGRAFYETIRQRGYTFPVVFVTGYDYESLALTTKDREVAILQKPFSDSSLLAQIAQLLGEPADAKATTSSMWLRGPER